MLLTSSLLVAGCDIFDSSAPDLDAVYTLLTADGIDLDPTIGMDDYALLGQVSFVPEPYRLFSVTMNSTDPSGNGIGGGGGYEYDPGTGTVSLSWPEGMAAGEEALRQRELVMIALPPTMTIEGDWLYIQLNTVADTESAFYPFSGAELGYRENGAYCADPATTDAPPWLC